MATDFHTLATEQLRQKMVTHANSIYQMVFPGCVIDRLSDKRDTAHPLDRHFGIDTILRLPSGAYLTLQEKYRDHTVLERFGADFTQEWKNAYQTEFENDGEWFHLAAQIYFYGWANPTYTGFAKWLILDIPKYKLLVEDAGGLDAIGRLKVNKEHGRAAFYAIPVKRIKHAIIQDYRQYL